MLPPQSLQLRIFSPAMGFPPLVIVPTISPSTWPMSKAAQKLGAFVRAKATPTDRSRLMGSSKTYPEPQKALCTSAFVPDIAHQILPKVACILTCIVVTASRTSTHSGRHQAALSVPTRRIATRRVWGRGPRLMVSNAHKSARAPAPLSASKYRNAIIYIAKCSYSTKDAG